MDKVQPLTKKKKDPGGENKRNPNQRNLTHDLNLSSEEEMKDGAKGFCLSNSMEMKNGELYLSQAQTTTNKYKMNSIC